MHASASRDEHVRHTNGIWIADEDSLPHLSDLEVRRPPIKLLLSLVGRCNLRCFHCLGTSEELVRSSQDPGSASRELVDFVVDRVMPAVRAIRLGGIGLTEQLTSRTFDYFLDRIEPHAPRLGSFELITNLSVMTAARADRLARSLTDVQVSIEGVEDNFTRLRSLPWPRLVKHFQMLREARARHPASRMKITLLACAMSDMLDDLLRFDVFERLGVQSIVLRELNPIAPHHEAHVLYREPEKTRAFIREFRRRAEAAGIEAIVTIADRYDPPPPAIADPAGGPGRRPELRSCSLPFEALSVVHTGQFGVCCYITDLAGPAPRLSTLSIMDVWNSPGFVALRKAVNSPAPPAVCLACEVKVGHLSEADREHVQLRAGLHAVEAERDGLRAETGALRAQLEASEADRAARLDVIHAQGRRLGEIEAEGNVLRAQVEDLGRHVGAIEADRAARLDVIHAQGHRLGEVEAERNVLQFQVKDLHRHADAIEADRAARLDVIHAQGRQLGEAQARLEDRRREADEQRKQIQALTAQVGGLEDVLRRIQATRAYRFLRRLGRWQFVEQRPAAPPASSSPTPPADRTRAQGP